MILLIDNYDSFTYNLVQALGALGAAVETVRNDAVTPEEVEARAPEGIVISPGPCTPREAGVSNEVIKRFAPSVPILGVCLGHQCIGHVFGGRVRQAERLMHGKTSPVYHDGAGVFKGLPNPFAAARYHSLLVERKSMPKVLTLTAWTEEGEVMGVRHKEFLVEGVQFHPESIMTQGGKMLLKNFLILAKAWSARHR